MFFHNIKYQLLKNVGLFYNIINLSLHSQINYENSICYKSIACFNKNDSVYVVRCNSSKLYVYSAIFLFRYCDHNIPCHSPPFLKIVIGNG